MRSLKPDAVPYAAALSLGLSLCLVGCGEKAEELAPVQKAPASISPALRERYSGDEYVAQVRERESVPTVKSSAKSTKARCARISNSSRPMKISKR